MKHYKLLPLVLLTLLSCSKAKDKEVIIPASKADFTFTDGIDHFELKNNSTAINGDVLTYKWASMCDTIKIINPEAYFASFNLPELSDNKQLKIRLTINNGHVSDSVTKDITLSKTTLERRYGLGIDLQDGHSNNVNYNWYYDQMNTGAYSFENCGPTTVTMAIKWVNPDFTKTPEDARNTYLSSGGWWYTNDIIAYLNQYSVSNFTIKIAHIDSIQRQIHLGNIAILCLDMYYVSNPMNDKWHVDKFYLTNYKGWGHFIVVKGYKVVDNKIFYEAYDPNSYGLKYTNDSIKGINRYYRSADLDSAVTKWWSYAIIVSKSKLKGLNYGVDVSKIIHKSGL